MRISDWSSDVCSSDLRGRYGLLESVSPRHRVAEHLGPRSDRLRAGGRLRSRPPAAEELSTEPSHGRHPERGHRPSREKGGDQTRPDGPQDALSWARRERPPCPNARPPPPKTPDTH